MLDIREAIKGNKNYGCDDLGLLSLPLGFIDSGAYGTGGARAAAAPPPQILGNSDFLGSTRKFGQSQFLKTSACFYYYFEEINIFYFNLKSA